MNNDLIVLLVAIPVAVGLISVPLVNQTKLSRALGLISFAAVVALGITLLVIGQSAAGILVSQMGGWIAPYGISMVMDGLSGLLVIMASFVALACLIHSFGSLTPRTERRYFHPLIQFMIAGVNLSFLTGDLFNLFVAFELMLMASYGLLIIGQSKPQMRHAFKYVLFNLLASAVFVIGAGMTYGMLGTLNMADLARITRQMSGEGTLPIGFVALGVLFFFVFALKAGVFPLWFWLADTYPNLPIALGALFGGVLTKVGVYAIARTFPLIFLQPDSEAVLRPMLAWGAGLTMVVGVLGALAYRGLRRVFCMLIAIGVGYAMMGVATGTGGALAGTTFYMAQSMLVLAAAFICTGMIEQINGSSQLADGGAMLKKHVWLGVVFLTIILGLVGLPPTAGFPGKLIVIREALGFGQVGLGIVAVVAGAFTLLAMLRIWGSLFWGPAAEKPEPAVNIESDNTDHELTTSSHTPPASAKLALGMLLFAAVALGFYPQPVLHVSESAGQAIAQASPYIDAVLKNPVYLRDLAMQDADHSSETEADQRLTNPLAQDNQSRPEADPDADPSQTRQGGGGLEQSGGTILGGFSGSTTQEPQP
jgi:multicomponent Na+:H+ antiporter subunit D